MNGQYRQCRQGVTLIEAVMVLIVLGSAAVASSFVMHDKWITNREVVGELENVVRIVSDARQTAVSSRTNVDVNFISAGSTSQVVVTRLAGPLAPEKRWTFDIAGSIQLKGSPTKITFAPNGNANRSLQWSVVAGKSIGRLKISALGGVITSEDPS